ncbi:type II toxin-antitoxin system HipA family toxin [Thiohalomonas denitrificans]|uniref:type II toxin-antitoxin system HipA family toxin n=1 Tax=Thiohalomonas denitrificans TaxID=415747 RepID=UPI0026ECD02F|nr:type II toxin-antitoxin system HipA family toxin [Thiohalomonas denitrificans]
MGRRSHTRTLSIWMNGELVGYWSIAPQAEQFQYADSWVQSPDARPLSHSLPITPDNAPYKGAKVRDWFENLLPDSESIRKRLAGRFGADSLSAFDLLAEIGRDCVGALQILPEGQTPPPATIEGEPLDEAGVASVLEAAVSPSRFRQLREDSDLRISIAGAQEKTALLRHEGQWLLPSGATPTTHIFKLPLGLIGGERKLDMRDSVENEWLCSRILHAYDLPVANCEVASFEGHRALIVERFDRRFSHDGSRLWRLPQEDLCQALGVSPLRKYEKDGGPGIGPIMEHLAHSANKRSDRVTFFEAQLLFWLLRAPDGHAKNFSQRLLPRGEFQLTPLYDVISVYPVLGNTARQISPHKVEMAMAIRGKNVHWKMKDIQRRHWNAVARHYGIGKDAEPIIARVIETTPRVIETVRAELPDNFPFQVAESILNGLRQSVALLARMSPE